MVHSLRTKFFLQYLRLQSVQTWSKRPQWRRGMYIHKRQRSLTSWPEDWTRKPVTRRHLGSNPHKVRSKVVPSRNNLLATRAHWAFFHYWTEKCLLRARNYKAELILLGGYNAHCQAWWYGDQTYEAGVMLHDLFSTFNITQKVHFPTCLYAGQLKS